MRHLEAKRFKQFAHIVKKLAKRNTNGQRSDPIQKWCLLVFRRVGELHVSLIEQRGCVHLVAIRLRRPKTDQITGLRIE